MKRISFELQGKDYKIPQYITIGDYVKIYKVKGLFDDEYFSAKLISIVTGAELNVLLEATREEVQFISNEILKILPFEKPAFVDRFELDGVHYGFIPSWKKMSFAEFADLDTLMTKKPEEILEYFHIITAILYRPITKEKSEHNFEIEKYDSNSLDDRAELFKNKLDVEYSLGAQFFFYSIRRELFKLYPNIFEVMDEDELGTDKVRMETQEDDMEITFEKRFGWYLVLNRVSNDDITRHEEVTRKTVLEVLNQLSYIVEKEREQIKQQKRAQGQLGS